MSFDVKSPYRPCKLPKILLADENKAFFVKVGNCNYWSRLENVLCQTTAMRQYYIFDIIKVHKNNLFWCFLSADSTLHAHISNISQTVRRVATSMIIFTCIKFLKFPLCHNEACKIGMSSATTISSISRRSLCLELFF